MLLVLAKPDVPHSNSCSRRGDESEVVAISGLRKEVRRLVGAVLALLLLTQPAHAQWDIDQLVGELDNFNGLIGQFCGGAEQAGNYIDFGDSISSAVTWVCALQPSINRIRDMAEGVAEDFSGFFANAIGDSFNSLAGAVGFELGDTDLGGLIEESINDLASGKFSVQALTGKLLRKVNLETLDSLFAGPDPAAPRLEKAVVEANRANPIRIGRELEAMTRRTQAMTRSANAQDVTNMAQQIASTALARGDEEKLVERVTNPNPIQGKQGTADLAQDRGKEANSTRAAVQAMVQAQADFMRQSVVSSANVVTALKEHAVQQTFTTQQLGMLAQSINEEQMREYNEWRETYFSELGKNLAKAEELRSNYASVIELLGGTGE